MNFRGWAVELGSSFGAAVGVLFESEGFVTLIAVGWAGGIVLLGFVLVVDGIVGLVVGGGETVVLIWVVDSIVAWFLGWIVALKDGVAV